MVRRRSFSPFSAVRGDFFQAIDVPVLVMCPCWRGATSPASQIQVKKQKVHLRNSRSGSGRPCCLRSNVQPAIEWVEDQDNVKRPIGAEPMEDVREKSEQVHVALLALTEGESLDIDWSSSGTIRSGSVETTGPSLGSSEWRTAWSSIATNLRSRSMQTAGSPRWT